VRRPLFRYNSRASASASPDNGKLQRGRSDGQLEHYSNGRVADFSMSELQRGGIWAVFVIILLAGVMLRM
jgi:hypothetical protein